MFHVLLSLQSGSSYIYPYFQRTSLNYVEINIVIISKLISDCKNIKILKLNIQYYDISLMLGYIIYFRVGFKINADTKKLSWETLFSNLCVRWFYFSQILYNRNGPYKINLYYFISGNVILGSLNPKENVNKTFVRMYSIRMYKPQWPLESTGAVLSKYVLNMHFGPI